MEEIHHLTNMEARWLSKELPAIAEERKKWLASI